MDREQRDGAEPQGSCAGSPAQQRDRAALHNRREASTSRKVDLQPGLDFVPPLHPDLDIERLGGRIGPTPEDFVVDEVPLYAFSGTGQHCFVRLWKRAVTTPEALKIVARAAGVPERQIGYAGLKDKQAVTSQWISLLERDARPPPTWELPEAVRVLEVTRHDNKLRTGHLYGNRFRIRVTGVDPAALSRAEPLAQRLRELGFPNYFGAQRFGRQQDNLQAALRWLRGGARARLSRFLLKLYPSVVQAEVFNRYVFERSRLGVGRLLQGECVRLAGSTRHFIVEDPAQEQARLASRDVCLTGPLIGPKGLVAVGEARELERRVMRSLELDDALLEVLGRFAPGSRRDLFVYPEELGVEVEGAGITLQFTLPAGAYATQLIREVTGAPYGSERLGRDADRERADSGSQEPAGNEGVGPRAAERAGSEATNS